ncbi:hypothetical protein [Streptomyces puniciscabiei]|uniref:hypothetical protein n=1 Tax=Streptomyces puniciscabiei TaxID=164348 RepID=UPI0037A634A5
MRFNDEDQIKRALGIDTWRNLSKDKMIRFVAMMPDMDTEVALKIVEQFPSFKDFALNVMDVMKTSHESTISANAQSQEHVHRAYQYLRETIRNELDKGDLTWEQRRELIEKMQEVVREQSQKDSENKRFLDEAHKKVLVLGAVALALGLAFVGGRVSAESKDSPEGTLEA